MVDGRDEIEKYAQRVIERLKEVPKDEIVFTSVQHGLGLTAVELIRELENRTSIGVAILEQYAIHGFLTWLLPLD